jgi:hypothetical protein
MSFLTGTAAPRFVKVTPLPHEHIAHEHVQTRTHARTRSLTITLSRADSHSHEFTLTLTVTHSVTHTQCHALHVTVQYWTLTSSWAQAPSLPRPQRSQARHPRKGNDRLSPPVAHVVAASWWFSPEKEREREREREVSFVMIPHERSEVRDAFQRCVRNMSAAWGHALAPGLSRAHLSPQYACLSHTRTHHCTRCTS